jgi:hypothetical protein
VISMSSFPDADRLAVAPGDLENLRYPAVTHADCAGGLNEVNDVPYSFVGTIRRHLAEQADLLGAIRLPNTAFKGNAGTEVTTDILFLRKRAHGAPPAGHAWRGLEMIESPDRPIQVNEYYARHPEMMLGHMRLEGTMYHGSEPTLDGQLTPELLRSAVECLPEGVYIPRDEARGPPPALLDADALTGIKDGAYAVRDGALVIRNGNSFEAANLAVSVEARIKGIMAVRDSVRLVFRTQLEDAPEERVIEARKPPEAGGFHPAYAAQRAPCPVFGQNA